MFWFTLLVIVLFGSWIIRIKSQQKAEVLYAEKVGEERAGIGVLIHKEMLSGTQARSIIETISDVGDLNTQLKIAEKDLPKIGKPYFHLGSLKQLQPELNAALNEKSGDWKLIVVKK